jgi:hypothetical protein
VDQLCKDHILMGLEVEGSCNLMAASLESVVAALVQVVVGGIILVMVEVVVVVVVRDILLVEVTVVEDLDYMASTSLQSVQEQWSHQASLNLSHEPEPQQKEANLIA